MGKSSISIHAYIQQKPKSLSPQLHITTKKSGPNEQQIHHKQIKIKQQEIIKILQEGDISQRKILSYLEYCVLSTIGRMKKNGQNNHRYKDIMDLIHHQNLNNQRDDLLVKPIYEMFKTHTENIPPDPTIRAKIWKRREKRNRR